MTHKSLKPRLAMITAGGLAMLTFAAGAAQATLLPVLPINVLGILDTTVSGQASASLGVVAAASTTGVVKVKVLDAGAGVLTSADVKIAADAELTVAYSLKAKIGTLASVVVTQAGGGCVALAVVSTGAVTGNIKATVATGGTSTVVQAIVSAAAGTAAKVVVCA